MANPHIPVTTAQMTRWRGVYAHRATEPLKLLSPRARQCVMRMMQVAERVSAQNVGLTDDVCRSIFFHSTVPGFLLRNDDTVAACRQMMRDVAEIQEPVPKANP